MRVNAEVGEACKPKEEQEESQKLHYPTANIRSGGEEEWDLWTHLAELFGLLVQGVGQ